MMLEECEFLPQTKWGLPVEMILPVARGALEEVSLLCGRKPAPVRTGSREAWKPGSLHPEARSPSCRKRGPEPHPAPCRGSRGPFPGVLGCPRCLLPHPLTLHSLLPTPTPLSPSPVHGPVLPEDHAQGVLPGCRTRGAAWLQGDPHCCCGQEARPAGRWAGVPAEATACPYTALSSHQVFADDGSLTALGARHCQGPVFYLFIFFILT